MWVRTGRIRVKIERGSDDFDLLIRRPTIGELDAWQSLITSSGTLPEVQYRVNAWLGSLYLGADGIVGEDGAKADLSWSDVEGELTGTEIVRAAMQVAGLHLFDAGALGKSSATPR